MPCISNFYSGLQKYSLEFWTQSLSSPPLPLCWISGYPSHKNSFAGEAAFQMHNLVADLTLLGRLLYLQFPTNMILMTKGVCRFIVIWNHSKWTLFFFQVVMSCNRKQLTSATKNNAWSTWARLHQPKPPLPKFMMASARPVSRFNHVETWCNSWHTGRVESSLFGTISALKPLSYCRWASPQEAGWLKLWMLSLCPFCPCALNPLKTFLNVC